MSTLPLSASLAQSLIDRFFVLLDQRSYAEMLAMMCDDVRWLRQGRWLNGKDEVLAVLQRRSSAMNTRHLVTNVVVDPPVASFDVVLKSHGIAVEDASEAHNPMTVNYLTAYRFDGEGAPPWKIGGPHKVSLVFTKFLQEKGHWKISWQLLLPEFVFDDH